MYHEPATGRSALINVMSRTVERVAKRLVRDFGEVENLQVSLKGPRNFVTNADIQAEKGIRAELAKARPQFGFLLEEGGEIPGQDPDWRWIVDPLDGTNNFLHGMPHFCISIAAEHKGDVIAGVIYDPLRDELFAAEKGKGAFLNNRRLRVSGRKDITQALLLSGFSTHAPEKVEREIKAVSHMQMKAAAVRFTGSTALDLAYVAAGRCEGFWHYVCQTWDIAAGLIIVREAGGLVTDLDLNKPATAECASLLATNGDMHRTLMMELNRACD